jgi:hypothetical protein
LNHRSTGYEPVGISWLPHPASFKRRRNDIYAFVDAGAGYL